MLKNCIVCGREFEAIHSKHTICSDKCRKIRKNINSGCNPPYECPSCSRPDCTNTTKITKAEREYLKAAELPFGRPSEKSYFPRIDDLLHKRSGRIV